MRSAPASQWMTLGCAALLGAGLAACGSDHPPAPVDSGSGADHTDTAPADVRPDVRPDLVQSPDLPPVDMPNLLCDGVAPTSNFSDPYVVANFDMAGGQTFGLFGQDPVAGGTYLSAGIVEDFTDLTWHITGSVTNDGHFGIYWGCSLPSTSGGCTLDTSRWKGIRFKIKGNVGPDNAMSLSLGRAENDPSGVNAGCGSCVVPTDTDAAAGDYCRGPRVTFPVDATARTVTVLWTDFVDGSPHASIDPHQITGMLWILHPAPATDTDGGADASSDGATDAADAGATSPDAGASDGGDDAGDGGAGPPSYTTDVTLDDIELVPF